MTTTKSNLLPLIISPGVQPNTDKTPLATNHFTFADKIRFRFGFPQKIGGWVSLPFNYGTTFSGYARTLFSAILSTIFNTLIGTSYGLYSVIGSVLTNITPFTGTPVAIAASINTDYRTLGSNPIATVNGSGLITVTDANAANYISGDLMTFSGATAVHGITIGELNVQQQIQTVSAGSYTIFTNGTATGTGSGGGASVVVATGLVKVSATGSNQPVGNRVVIAAATATGGLSLAQLNAEFIVRLSAANDFYVMTTGTATSLVTAGGGSSTTYEAQIPAGNINQSIGFGYGMGLYGIGLYGTALEAVSDTFSYPQIWFVDRFGVDLIMTPGNQGGLYSWNGSVVNAPTPITGTDAPTAVNYAFVSNNILVTFGAGGTVNRILTSDQGNFSTWVAASSNQVFDYTVAGASQLLSHVPVAGVNLIFTRNATYLFQYTGFTAGAANAIWNVQLLDQNVGIIGPMARVSIEGTAYWMDVNDFHMWAGANISTIPAADQDQATIYNYVFSNINYGQGAKCFAWFNEKYNEIWWHYPSADSNECNMVARYNIIEQHWTMDTFDRTCGEYPNLIFSYPRLISSENVLYQHETGTDADGEAMPFTLTTNLRGGSNIMYREYGLPPRETSLMTGFIPDSIQTGNINVNVTALRYPQSPIPTYNVNYTVTPTTEFMPVGIGGRFWQYTISGNELGQEWTAGQWMEYVQPSSFT